MICFNRLKLFDTRSIITELSNDVSSNIRIVKWYLLDNNTPFLMTSTFVL